MSVVTLKMTSDHNQVGLLIMANYETCTMNSNTLSIHKQYGITCIGI